MKAPFPWFGGKSRAANLIWQGLGNPVNYVEPFAGSLGVLLNRPNYDGTLHTETVNDLDCYLVNFWRALQSDPEGVAKWADYPITEVDLHARHSWLIGQEEFKLNLADDPSYYNSKIAGWWVWGINLWIGRGWCKEKSTQLPHLGDGGCGIHRKTIGQLPHLGDGGKGIHRKSASTGIEFYLSELSQRLRKVRVCNGDWSRVLTPSVTEKHGITGIVLDPPYSHKLRDASLYSEDHDISENVRKWAITNGNNPKLRIALCGYNDEHVMPQDWVAHEWLAASGYAKNDNRLKECVWLSPHCLPISSVDQLSLLE